MSKVGAVALASVIAVAIGIAIGYGIWHGGSSIMNNGMMGGGMMGANGRRERSGPAPQSGAPTINVTAREFSFSPNHLRVKARQTVNIEFSDSGDMFHTFTVVGGPTFNLQANAGQSITGALTLARPGTYQFICSVPGHAQAGMEGTITVA